MCIFKNLYCQNHFPKVSYNCKYTVTTANVKIGAEKFTFSGKKLIDPGFTAVMTWQALGESEEDGGSSAAMPAIAKGDALPVKDIKIAERQTTPPDYLTESDLITLMEKHGIGTDASIPVHINNICQRNYVTVGSGRRLVPTTLGIVLVHGYLAIDPDLVHPQVQTLLTQT